MKAVAADNNILSAFMEEIRTSALEKRVIVFGNSLSHLAPLFVTEFPKQIRLIFIWRHPLSIVCSAYVQSNIAWWNNIPSWADDPHGNKITPFDSNAYYKIYEKRWASLSHFERILYNILERIHQNIEFLRQFPEISKFEIRLEELFAERSIANEIARFAGLPTVSSWASPASNNIWKRTLEEKPLGESWKSYAAHDEFCSLCRQLGYSLAPEDVQAIVGRYQLPRGLMSKFRHATGYWQKRERLVSMVRSAGIMRARKIDPGVEPKSSW